MLGHGVKQRLVLQQKFPDFVPELNTWNSGCHHILCTSICILYTYVCITFIYIICILYIFCAVCYKSFCNCVMTFKFPSPLCCPVSITRDLSRHWALKSGDCENHQTIDVWCCLGDVRSYTLPIPKTTRKTKHFFVVWDSLAKRLQNLVHDSSPAGFRGVGTFWHTEDRKDSYQTQNHKDDLKTPKTPLFHDDKAVIDDLKSFKPIKIH